MCIYIGVDDIDIDMSMQKVTVTGWADRKKVLKKVRKTGLRAEIWQMPYNPELRNTNSVSQNHGHHQHYSGSAAYYGAGQPLTGSSYNYYKHGYRSQHGSGYYHNSAHSSTIFGHQTGAAFSDENPNACSVM